MGKLAIEDYKSYYDKKLIHPSRVDYSNCVIDEEGRPIAWLVKVIGLEALPSLQHERHHVINVFCPTCMGFHQHGGNGEDHDSFVESLQNRTGNHCGTNCNDYRIAIPDEASAKELSAVFGRSFLSRY